MTKVLDRAVDFLANRLDRRGFLAKSAVVGSAVVAAPLNFGLKPQSAYAAVCSCNGSSCTCGSLCCDGYTEFCCTLNGVNACPPGTMTAGWWKVDGSQFCGGAARYYLDCNAQCGGCTCGSNGVCAGSCSGTGCGCAKGSCNNRKAGCTRFRYGQCNQHVRCVGPIVCRVVTCKPPWQFDPACGTSSRTDNATRNHDRPCLNEPFGHLDSVVDTGRGSVQVKGWAVAQLDYGTTRVRIFVDGNFVRETMATISRADVWQAYPAFGANHGYDVEVPAAPGRRMVCAYAVDLRNGRSTFLGYKEVDVAGTDGRIDSLIDLGGGRVWVVGWATDRPNAPTTVRLTCNGVVQDVQTTLERRDVVKARPGSYLRCGFSAVLTVAPGRRQVCGDVVASDGKVTRFRCGSVELASVPMGRLDSATHLGGGRVRVRGWAIDPPLGVEPAQVNLTVDGTVVATITANALRQDVADVYVGYGARHGFDHVIDVPPGTHQICVQAVSGSVVTPLRCRDVTVPGGG